MKTAVYGLGHVGLVTALGLAKQGHDVIGVDRDEKKISQLNKGSLYIEEKGLAPIFEEKKHDIDFVSNLSSLENVRTTVICVGTPTQENGDVSMEQLYSTLKEINSLRPDSHHMDIIIRSTIPPGTIKYNVFPRLGSSLPYTNVYYQPEFLREGSAIEDYFNPSLTVVGVEDPFNMNKFASIFPVAQQVNLVGYKTAEMIKYVNNSFHALKVCYINEVASIAASYKADVSQLVKCFLMDKNLNISEKYLQPGAPFGGSCLTKDVKALSFLAKNRRLNIPLINSILPSNHNHLERIFNLVKKLAPTSLVFWGISFKVGTNDQRYSPVLSLIELLEQNNLLQDKETFVYDSKLTIQGVKTRNLVNIRVAENISELPRRCELIILGAYAATNDECEYLNQHNGYILDLGFKTGYRVKSKKIIRTYDII